MQEYSINTSKQYFQEGAAMAEIPPELGDKIHRSTLDVLTRVSADLTALGVFASVDEALPNQQASIRLFHESAQRGCAQLKHYLELWYALVRGRQWDASSSGLLSVHICEREALWLKEQAQRLTTQLRTLEAIGAMDTLREAQRCVDLYETAYALHTRGLRVEVKGHFLVINGAKQSETCVNGREGGNRREHAYGPHLICRTGPGRRLCQEGPGQDPP